MVADDPTWGVSAAPGASNCPAPRLCVSEYAVDGLFPHPEDEVGARGGIGSVALLLGRVAEWQTRWLQVPVRATSWGFKSPLAHHGAPAQAGARVRFRADFYRIFYRSRAEGLERFSQSCTDRPLTGDPGYTGDPADETVDSFDQTTAVNLRGVWACMRHELRHMRTQGSGAIINCSSLGGLVGQAGRASYHASKHGVIGLTKSAAVDYPRRGIRINAVCPGVIATPMNDDLIQNHPDRIAEIMRDQPIGRLGRAEEVAAAVLWLASPAASFIHGVALPVDGGFTAH